MPSDNDADSRASNWPCLGENCLRNQIVFLSQIILLYVVVIVSLINLTFGDSDNRFWLATCSGALGYILPSPKL